MSRSISVIASPSSHFDFGMGEGDEGFRHLLDVQPVIPIALGDGWSLITRVHLGPLPSFGVLGTWCVERPGPAPGLRAVATALLPTGAHEREDG